jgi:membrane peptidoglycan carboxypeptidase
VLVNLTKLKFSQGGSTITQQVIKNALLTRDKTVSRKIKEWVLAFRLEKVMTKNQILGVYLNESSYGGNMYGVEEASQAYFAKQSKDVTLAEAAYLAALPQAPSYYSPYGNHRDQLALRQNLVLRKMKEQEYITADEYRVALKEKVVFAPQEARGIKAPHFVVIVKEYLEETYGEEVVGEEGLTVITTLDYDMQVQAQDKAKKYALQNEKDFKENAGVIGVDPKTGQILVMVGSRDYFDKEIEGNFNVTLAHRQPGSAFKPFAYAKAFEKGYLPETMLFDVKTQFSTECRPDSTPFSTGAQCYAPVNYDGLYRGPISMRSALAQSINVPAIEVLYLAGIKETLTLARDFGINSLGDANQYGLTLVLGGGEVSLLDITSAYGVFANEGVRNPHQMILSVKNLQGDILEEYKKQEVQVIDKNVALTITDVLKDNEARTPAFGAASPLYFPGREVAVKTGTTNDYRDAWIIGYTPSIALGAWVGNNNNSSMEHKVARYIVAPLWHDIMADILKKVPVETFNRPEPKDLSTYKPILRGLWQGGQSYTVDKTTGKLATEFTPVELREERVVREVHSILHWVDKNNPLGPAPTHPINDSQYPYWEYAVKLWAQGAGITDETSLVIPTVVDDTHKPEYAPQVTVVSPSSNTSLGGSNEVEIKLGFTTRSAIRKVEFYLNGTYLGFENKAPFSFFFIPIDAGALLDNNELRVVAEDVNSMKGETTFKFSTQ